MKPRAVILENVPQILQQADELIAALTTCKAYVFKVLKFQTADYGIPHHRLRVYIIMLRTDAVVHGTHQAFSNIARVMKECVQPTPCSWPMWLKKDRPSGVPGNHGLPGSHGLLEVCPRETLRSLLCSQAMPRTRLQVQAVLNLSSNQEEEVRLASQCQKLSEDKSEGCKEVLERVADDQEESSSQNAAFLLGSGFTFRSASARTFCHKP